MLGRIMLSVVVAVAVILGCWLIGAIFTSFGISLATTIGQFLITWNAVIGALAGFWFFFSGRTTLL